MKNIKDFIVAEAKSDIPKKEKDDLLLIVSSLVEGYYSEGADDMEEFVKDKLKDSHWSEQDINSIVELCEDTLEKTESHLEKISDREEDDEETKEEDDE